MRAWITGVALTSGSTSGAARASSSAACTDGHTSLPMAKIVAVSPSRNTSPFLIVAVLAAHRVEQDLLARLITCVHQEGELERYDLAVDLLGIITGLGAEDNAAAGPQGGAAGTGAGAAGFILKDAPGEDLIRATTIVAAGGASMVVATSGDSST